MERAARAGDANAQPPGGRRRNERRRGQLGLRGAAVPRVRPEARPRPLPPGTGIEPDSVALATRWAEQLGIDFVVEDITATLEACGCYRRRDDAIRRLVPEYGEAGAARSCCPATGSTPTSSTSSIWSCNPRAGKSDAAASRDGVPRDRRRDELQAARSEDDGVLPRRPAALRRARHANRLEFDQGFFVKGGDGARRCEADRAPVQGSGLSARRISRRPGAVTSRPPTTDTYSLAQTQEEFYFSVPMAAMDLILHAHNASTPERRTRVAPRIRKRADRARVPRDRAEALDHTLPAPARAPGRRRSGVRPGDSTGASH